MGINNINLPYSVLADLYRNSLISATENDAGPDNANTPPSVEVQKPVLAEQEKMKWLGENTRNILVLIKYPGVVHLPDSSLTFLTGVLKACNLGLGDVAVLNIHHYPDSTYKELISFFKARVVFLFDIEPSSIGLPVSFPHFQLQPFAGNTFLYSPRLEELATDKVLKSKLWVCLKRLFNI